MLITKKELPIADVVITASDGIRSAATRSDASGYFKLVLHKRVLSDQPIHGHFPPSALRTAGLNRANGKIEDAGPALCCRHGTPHSEDRCSGRSKVSSSTQPSPISGLKYPGEVYDQHPHPDECRLRSQDLPGGQQGKCALRSPVSLFAGWQVEGDLCDGVARCRDRQYVRQHNRLLHCGPCPFTRIDSSGFIHGGRNISVTALNWSDTATFLMEAEVYHTAISSEVRELYPVNFGQTLNFTLPPTQEGVSLEAELDGAPMVFPLGPESLLELGHLQRPNWPGTRENHGLPL